MSKNKTLQDWFEYYKVEVELISVKIEASYDSIRKASLAHNFDYLTTVYQQLAGYIEHRNSANASLRAFQYAIDIENKEN